MTNINKPFAVKIYDNYHYMDESETYISGTYATHEEAVEHCRQIVDEFLLGNYKPGMTGGELNEGYRSFGEDPMVSYDTSETKEIEPRFSAWGYAEQRCQEICKNKGDKHND